jgi:hypothetical protein
MLPLYGEGERAFMRLRLQLEILKGSNDESIFAWAADSKKDYNGKYISRELPAGLLASSTACFRDSGDIRLLRKVSRVGSGPIIPHYVERPPFSMTNRGLQICFPLFGRA